MSTEERKVLIEAIIGMLNESNEKELRYVYLLLLNMKKQVSTADSSQNIRV